jgi:hypothetical protein
MVRSAIYAALAILALGVGLGFAMQNQESAAEHTVLDAQRDQLAQERGLVQAAPQIRHEISVLRARSGETAKHVLIDRARRQRGITLREFTLDASGTHFSMKIAGSYADIVSATVAIPAQSPNVSLSAVRIDADASAGRGNAVATLTGMFAS